MQIDDCVCEVILMFEASKREFLNSERMDGTRAISINGVAQTSLNSVSKLWWVKTDSHLHSGKQA